MEDIIKDLSTYGYLILFFYSLSGGIVALVAAGILSSQGSMNIWICIATAMAANIIGDAALVWLSRYNKSAVMPYIKKHRRKLALSHLLIKRQGAKIIIMQKFIYGLKTLVPLAIGFTKYPILRFNIISTIGACLWAFVMGFGSYYAGTYFAKFFNVFSDKPYIALIILLVLVGLIWTYFNFATKKNKPPL
ncbi:MAG: DedA family protein [Campylobacteraceae bacterium]|nr:DedA family protein [Campylobacteraceae bacterium]